RWQCLPAASSFLHRFVSYDGGAAVDEGDFNVAQFIRLHFTIAAADVLDDGGFSPNALVRDHHAVVGKISFEWFVVFVLEGFPEFLFDGDDRALALRSAHRGLRRRRWRRGRILGICE